MSNTVDSTENRTGDRGRAWAIASVALVAILVVVGVTATRASADDGTVCAESHVRMVANHPDYPTAATVDFGVELAPGRYTVTLTAWDGYQGRTDTPADGQLSERVTALGVTTDDLTDGTEQASSAIATGEVEISAPMSAVVVNLAASSPGPNSVGGAKVCLSPIVEPAPEPELVEVDPVDPIVEPAPEPEPELVEAPAPIIVETAPAPEISEPVDVERQPIVEDLPEAQPAQPIAAQPTYNG